MDGQISWTLRKPWRDGTKAFVMTPYEFIARLAALVPHPRQHQLSYHGVPAPAGSLRDLVVPRRAAVPGPNPTDSDAVKHSGCPVDGVEAQSYVPWAELLKRVLGRALAKSRGGGFGGRFAPRPEWGVLPPDECRHRAPGVLAPR